MLGSERGHEGKGQSVCKPGSVSGFPPDDHSSGTSVAERLVQPTRTTDPETGWAEARVIPIRSCSRWGLPCRPRYRARGGLLHHLFTLTPAHRGGSISVALSLRSPSPGVTRHRVSVEPGLSSRTGFRHLSARSSNRLAGSRVARPRHKVKISASVAGAPPALGFRSASVFREAAHRKTRFARRRLAPEAAGGGFGMAASERGDVGGHFGAVGARRAVHAGRAVAGVVAENGAASVATSQLVGAGQVGHAPLEVGFDVVEAGS